MASLARAIHAHWLGVPWLVDDCLGNLRCPIRSMVLPGGHLTRACSRRADRSYLGPSPRGARLMRRAVRPMTTPIRALANGSAALIVGLVVWQLDSALRMPAFSDGSFPITYGWDGTLVIGGGLYL